jgi:hypothetical protein
MDVLHPVWFIYGESCWWFILTCALLWEYFWQPQLLLHQWKEAVIRWKLLKHISAQQSYNNSWRVWQHYLLKRSF